MNSDLQSIDSVLSNISGLYQFLAQKTDCNYYEMQVLCAIFIDELHLQKEIVTNYQMPKQTVSSEITKLVKKNYILLIPDEKDKRAKVIVLTDEGRTYAKKLLEPMLAVNEKTVKRMGREKYKQMVSSMQEYARELEQVVREM